MQLPDIPKLTAKEKGNPENSKGADVAASVNLLIDRVATNVTISVDSPNNTDGKPDGSFWYKIAE